MRYNLNPKKWLMKSDNSHYQNKKNVIKKTLLVILWRHLSKRRQKQLLLLLILMIIASLAEIVSIGAVLPFLGVITAPEQVYQHQLMQPFIQILELTEPRQLILPLTMLFITTILVSSAVRLTLLYAMTRFTFAVGADLSINIYRRTLYQEYEVHVLRNSSEVIIGIISKTKTVIGGVISPSQLSSARLF